VVVYVVRHISVIRSNVHRNNSNGRLQFLTILTSSQWSLCGPDFSQWYVAVSCIASLLLHKTVINCSAHWNTIVITSTIYYG